MAISKIQYKASASATTEVWMDTTDKTVDSEYLLYGYTALKNDGTTVTGNMVGGGAVTVVDEPDEHGGIIKHITSVNISDTTAVAADVMQGKYFYTADGTKTVGTNVPVRAGIPIDITNHLEKNEWVRPSEYPDLDSIDLTGFEGVYLTYDIRKFPDNPYISIYANVVQGSTKTEYYVQRGHLSNGEFAVDETHTVESRAAYRDVLDSENGNVQLWRITGDGDIKSLYFSTNSGDSSEAISGGCQPVVERRGRLPNCESFGSSISLSTNTVSYMYNSTYWLENDYMILPTSGIGMRYCYRDSYSLQKFTLLPDGDGKIVVGKNESNSAQGMFQDCISLIKIDLQNLQLAPTSTVLDALFSGCISVLSINLSGFLISGNTYSFGSLFNRCSSLRTITFGKNIAVSSMSYLFSECYSLQDVDLNKLDVSSVQSMYQLFNRCMSIKTIDLSSWSTPNDVLTDTRYMFDNTYSLINLTMPNYWGVSSSATNANNVPNVPMLRNFNGMEIYVNHSYASAINLSQASLLNILNRLPTIAQAKTITLGSVNLHKLTAEQIAIATAKGWTVSS